MNSRAHPFGRFLEDFQIGDVYEHWPHKTISESDNNLFCLLSMNHHPLHSDDEFAKMTQHGRPVVVGTLVFSLAVGMTVSDVSGRAIANLRYDEVEHTNPVYVGDTIRATTEVLETRASRSKPDRGIVRVVTTVYNQDNKPVLRFRRTVLVPRRSAGA